CRLPRWIRPDDQVVITTAHILVGCTGWQQHDITGVQSDRLTLRTTQQNIYRTARTAQHLMRRRVEMVVIEDAIAPRALPGILPEERFDLTGEIIAIEN